MRITNFEATGFQRLNEWIEKNNIKQLDEKTIKEALKTANISFVAEEIDRMQSTLLCELKASYVQQSQRYVTLNNTSYILPSLDKDDYNEAIKLTDKCFALYNKMSEPKDIQSKGRPKAENYKHNIPIEDARYILPLSTKTNLCMAMAGDKLYDLFCLINDSKYGDTFSEFRAQLYSYIPSSLTNLLPDSYNTDKNMEWIKNLYIEDFNKINVNNNVIYLNSFENLGLKVGLGALTSTQAITPSQTLEGWGEEASNKSNGVVKRVLGYGHESIAEQARTTFGMMCSMVTYHQQIRHRLPEIHREDFTDLITEKLRAGVIPPNIQASIFVDEYKELVNQIKDFRLYIYHKYGQDKALPFILNCDQVKLIMSTNSRIDVKMLSERVCMNAQWEIRELSIKKLKILREISDILYENALPSCVNSKCREGKLTCGRQEEIKAILEISAREI